MKRWRKSGSCSGFSYWLVSAVLVASLITQFSQVSQTFARPGNVLTSQTSPSAGAPAKEKRDIGAGDLSYASSTGALNYSYEIPVPPGRLGVQPSLSLSYSSQGSLRGGVASGWSLDIPMIQRDLSDGTTGFGVGSSDHDDLPFVSSLSGGHRLVQVDEPVEPGWKSYRAEYDDLYIRYERHSNLGMWRARTLDGKTWYFGTRHTGEDTTADTDAPASLISGTESYPLLDRQPLTRMVDRFGNTVRYFWHADIDVDTGFAQSLRLSSIRYTENLAAGSGIGSHARVEFVYGDEVECGSFPTATLEPDQAPVGASHDWHVGTRWLSGTRPLDRIETYAKNVSSSGQVTERRVRRVALQNSSICPDTGGALRQLDSITVTDPNQPAGSAAALMPPVTFSYGANERSFQHSTAFQGLQNTANWWGHSLTWGFTRGYDNHGEPSIEQTLLDFDGDGRLDMLVTDNIGAECGFAWHRNNGNGFEPLGTHVDFPDEDMKWADGTTPGVGEGCSLSARRTLWKNSGESCPDHYGNYLQYRFLDMNRDGLPDLVTSIRYDKGHINSNIEDVPGIANVLSESFPVSLDPEGACRAISPDEVQASKVSPCQSGRDCSCSYFDRDILENYLETAKHTPCGDFSEQEPAGWNTSVCGAQASNPIERFGHYPWMIYYNENGTLDLAAPQRLWSPVPLDPAGEESSLGTRNGSSFSSKNQALVDITGDGVLDLMVSGSWTDADAHHLNVFVGFLDDTTGRFSSFSATPYYWIAPQEPRLSASTSVAGSYWVDHDDDPSTSDVEIETLQVISKSQLVDINGDGLQDLVRNRTGLPLEVALNMGSGFCANSEGEVMTTTLPLAGAVARTGYDDVNFACQPAATTPGEQSPCGTQIATRGDGISLTRMVDVDGDGLVDFYDSKSNVELHLPSEVPLMHPNRGGVQFPHVKEISTYLPHEVTVDNTTAHMWASFSDFMDLNGDGVDDIISDDAANYGWTLESEDTTSGKPLRLLNAIDNGQGVVKHIEYQPYNDPSVEAKPGEQPGMPSHLWVVHKITTSSQLASSFDPPPDSVVEMRYGDVVYEKDHRARYGFRGFSTIATSAAHQVGSTSGFAVTRKKYDYELDWSGRVTKTTVYPFGFPTGSGNDRVSSISVATWHQWSLFNGQTLSHVQLWDRRRNCLQDNGLFKTESTCLQGSYSSDKYHLYASYRHYTGSVGGSPAPLLAYQRIRTWESPKGRYTGWNAEESVLHHGQYRLYADEDQYHLMHTRQKLFEGTGSAHQTASDVIRYPDPSGRFFLQQQTSTSADSATAAWSNSETDPETGNLLAQRKPNQWPSGPQTTIGYQGFKLAPNSVTNELDQTTTSVVDNATGAVLENRNPRLTDCGQNHGSKTDYDLLGRPIAVYEFACSGAIATEELRSTLQYEDYDPVSGVPAHVTTTTFLDTSGDTTQNTVYVDGSGRAVRSETDDGSGTPIVSTSFFNARGLLERYKGPNPSTQTGATEFVDVSYAYDSLGRATGMRQGEGSGGTAPEPGTSAWDDFTGVDLEYRFDGIQSKTVSTEHVNDTGPAGKTITYADFFGRLVRVDELLSTGGYAETLYEFDSNNNIKRITDSDNVITEMQHDWVGRRTKVIRDERVWSYAYDTNGNMIMDTSPNDLGETADNPGAGLYSTSTVYDELDRPTSQILAVRTLSEAQLDNFDAREVGYQYDSCEGGVGQVCRITVGSNLTTTLVYDNAGRPVETTQSIELPESVINFGDANMAPDFIESRTSYVEYNLAGAVTEVWLPDRGSQAESTHLSYTYDALGAPQTLTYHGAGGDVVASVERNKAQRITAQTIGCLTRTWDYDYLGRVVDTAVSGGTGDQKCTQQNGVVLSEAMTFFDSSEVETQDVYRAGLATRHFEYSYDAQHQLTAARNSLGNGSDQDYNVGFAYSHAGRLTEVAGHPSGGAIVGRDSQIYTHGEGLLLGADKHAPTYLAGPNKNLAYQHDFAGNVVHREETLDPGGIADVTSWSFRYDGTDQQREVSLDDGSNGRELYYYDHAGQRYMAVTFDNDSAIVPSRVRVWMGAAEIWYAPNTSTGTMDVESEYGHFGLGAIPVGRIKHEHVSPFIITTTAEASFHNGLQHMMGAVDWETGVVNASFVYGPYGELLESVGSETEEHLRRFNGKESDQLSRLSYYGYRYYDGSSLTWTQADPLYLFAPDLGFAEPRRMALYSFSLNNPVRYFDPDGREAKKEKITQVITANIEQDMCAGSNPNFQCLGTVKDGKHKGKFLYKVDKNLENSEGGDPSGNTDTVQYEILGGSGLLGIIPAITVRVRPATAKALDGLKLVGMALSAAGGVLAKKALGKLGKVLGKLRNGKPKSLGAAAKNGFLNWSSKSRRTFGHTFTRHGGGAKNTRGLTGRASSTGQPQGQWLDNDTAADFLATERPYLQGPASVELPSTVNAQVVLPNGTIVPATRARLIPSSSGGYTSAFPIP